MPEASLNILMAARDSADILFTRQQVEEALKAAAERMALDVSDSNPLLIGIMNGALVTLGHLVTYLDFPLELDYLHATRYDGEISGCELQWIKEPRLSLIGRTIVLIDEILDEGITLKEVVDYCYAAGAKQVKTFVLAEKDRQRELAIKADYTALNVPNRYVFGFGMDYKGYWRNLDGIYAVAQS